MRYDAPRGLLPLVIWLASACGGAKTETPPAVTPDGPEPPAASPAPALTDTPSESAAAPASEPSAAPASAESAPAAAEDPNVPRNVRYIMTQDGLKVEVIGARFVVNVKAVRTPAGFEIKVEVDASASEARSLLAPDGGPLAFAGSVKRAGAAEPERFGDERKGDGEQSLGAGKPVKLSRSWPGKGGRPLGNGEVLELDVGLWGLGHDAGDRRAVKQFAHVKARVDKWKASARVEPPPNLVGK